MSGTSSHMSNLDSKVPNLSSIKFAYYGDYFTNASKFQTKENHHHLHLSWGFHNDNFSSQQSYKSPYTVHDGIVHDTYDTHMATFSHKLHHKPAKEHHKAFLHTPFSHKDMFSSLVKDTHHTPQNDTLSHKHASHN